MINLNKYDYVIFDCDGVILESNKMKSDAFVAALPNEPAELVNKFVTYHKENGGISRYKKFKYYFKVIKKKSNPQSEITDALGNFATIVSEGLLNCNYIPGVVVFIKKLHKANKRLFVVSGSDEIELNQVFIKREINHYFQQIYGSPTDKVENTRKVVSIMNKTKKGVFIGDSKSDYEAANQFGLDFIFVKGFSEWQDAKIIMNKTIKDFLGVIV